MIRYPLPELSEEDEGTPKEMYYRAAQLGASYQGRASSQICARFYPSCPHNAEELINIFVSEDVQTNEIDTQPANHLQPPSSSAKLPFFIHPRQVVQHQQQKPIVTQQQPRHQQPQQQQRAQPVRSSPIGQQQRPTVAPTSSLRQRLVAPAA